MSLLAPIQWLLPKFLMENKHSYATDCQTPDPHQIEPEKEGSMKPEKLETRL